MSAFSILVGDCMNDMVKAIFMKRLIAVLLLGLVIVSCGSDDGGGDENPIITRTANLDISVSSADFVDAGDFLIADVGQTINIAQQQFSAELANITEYRINRVLIQISGYSATSDAHELVFLDLGVGEGPSLTTVTPNLKREDTRFDATTPIIGNITDNNGAIMNVAAFVLYDRENEATDLLDGANAAIDFILQAFQNNDDMLTRVRMGVTGDSVGPFTFSFQFNVSVR